MESTANNGWTSMCDSGLGILVSDPSGNFVKDLNCKRPQITHANLAVVHGDVSKGKKFNSFDLRTC